jgi:predicted nucleic acid-binding protein
MLFVYLFENTPRFASRVEQIYARMQQRQDVLCSSPLVFAEVLTGPTIIGDLHGQEMITDFFQSSEVGMVNFSMEAAPIFARVRAAKVRSADAMHIAIAAAAGVDLFLTNDSKLTRLAIPGLPLIASLDTDVF